MFGIVLATGLFCILLTVLGIIKAKRDGIFDKM
jgi:hypothetical protein